MNELLFHLFTPQLIVSNLTTTNVNNNYKMMIFFNITTHEYDPLINVSKVIDNYVDL